MLRATTSIAQTTKKRTRMWHLLSIFTNYTGQLQGDFTITATWNTAAAWVPCYAVWPQPNLWNANFIWIVSFNRLQKWVGESEGLVHELLSGQRGSFSSTRHQPVGKTLQTSTIEIHVMMKYIQSDVLSAARSMSSTVPFYWLHVKLCIYSNKPRWPLSAYSTSLWY